MKKLLLLLLIIALAFGANVYAPQLAEDGLYAALAPRMELHRSDVKVQASPGIKIMAGNIDAIHVRGRDVRFGKLQLSDFNCDLQGVHFDPEASLLQRKLTVMKAASGDLSASVSADSLRRFMTDNIDHLSDAQVEFANDMVYLRGTVSLGVVVSAKARIEGTFAMKDNQLLLIPSRMSVEGMNIERILDIKHIVVYDFSDFPLGIRPDVVTMRDGVLTIHGKVSN